MESDGNCVLLVSSMGALTEATNAEALLDPGALYGIKALSSNPVTACIRGKAKRCYIDY